MASVKARLGPPIVRPRSRHPPRVLRWPVPRHPRRRGRRAGRRGRDRPAAGASPRNGLYASSSPSPASSSSASPDDSAAAEQRGEHAPCRRRTPPSATSSRNGLYSAPNSSGSSPPARASAARRRSASRRAATFAGAPVPAGMSLPMMTFSLRPIRWSLAPLMAASVSTRVVSWKDAAARKLAVLREAFVTPEQDDLRGRGLAALGKDAVVRLLEVEAVDELGREEVRVARLVDADLAEHLPDDDLDVLVVDRDALAPVDLLDFLDQVALHGVLAAGLEVLLRVDRAVGDRVAGADLLAVLDEELRVVGDRVLALDPVLGADGEVVAVPDQDTPSPARRRRSPTRPCPTRGPGPGPSRRGRRPRRATSAPAGSRSRRVVLLDARDLDLRAARRRG